MLILLVIPWDPTPLSLKPCDNCHPYQLENSCQLEFVTRLLMVKKCKGKGVYVSIAIYI
jgi:hypothetical protein